MTRTILAAFLVVGCASQQVPARADCMTVGPPALVAALDRARADWEDAGVPARVCAPKIYALPKAALAEDCGAVGRAVDGCSTRSTGRIRVRAGMSDARTQEVVSHELGHLLARTRGHGPCPTGEDLMCPTGGSPTPTARDVAWVRGKY